MTESSDRPAAGEPVPAPVTGQVTSWTLIDRAAGGSAAAQAEFYRRYLPVVRTYLASRWRGDRSNGHLEDAEQEVFLRCLRDGGVLSKADPARQGGFQAYLFGVTRNVALELEARDARSAARAGASASALDQLASREERASQLFDRAFARAVVREAAELMRARAEAVGERARRRVELLRLRFEKGIAIRTVAERWGADPAQLRREYVEARGDFERALYDAAAEHLPGGTAREVQDYCRRLLDLLA